VLEGERIEIARQGGGEIEDPTLLACGKIVFVELNVLNNRSGTQAHLPCPAVFRSQ
jgi:hypothetical protein